MVTIVIPVVLFYHGKYKKKEGKSLLHFIVVITSSPFNCVKM
jgi:hypothetical protein